MKGTLRIATLFGIPVEVHWSFGLLVMWVIYSGYSGGSSLVETLWYGLFVLILFLCVVMHEYGHALTARRYGVETKDIILLPIGGVARLNALPEKPWQEFFVAIAGPLVNVAIAVLLFGVLKLVPELESLPSVSDSGVLNVVGWAMIPAVFTLNILLVVFNMIPAFPMDGGRVLRALLALKLSRIKATQVASIIGQIFGIGFVLLGVFDEYLFGENVSVVLPFIGVFIFFMAMNEYRMVRQESLLNDYTVNDLVRADFTRLHLNDAMSLPIVHLKQGEEHNFLVFDANEQVMGVLHEGFIQEAIRRQDYAAPVAEYMSPRYESVAPHESLRSVVHKIQDNGYSILPVRGEELDDELIGVIDVQMLESFLRGQRKKSVKQRYFG